MSRLNKKLIAVGLIVGPKGKKGKAHRLSLDLELSDGIVDDDEKKTESAGFLQKKTGFVRAITTTYSDCMRCGKDKVCKVNKFGDYVNMTKQQIAGWAQALVSASIFNLISYLIAFIGCLRSWCHAPQPSQESPLRQLYLRAGCLKPHLSTLLYPCAARRSSTCGCSSCRVHVGTSANLLSAPSRGARALHHRSRPNPSGPVRTTSKMWGCRCHA
jgi:hypothetical protein